MKKIKKIMPLMLGAVLALVACEPPATSSGDDSIDDTSSTSSIDDGILEIASFSLPKQLVETYLPAFNNLESVDKINTEYELKTNRFFQTDNASYKVGDDNPFIFFPNIVVYKGNGIDTQTLTSYHSIAEVEIKEGSEYRLLVDGPDKANFVSVDTENSSFKFTEDAIDHSFRLTVLPDPTYYEYDSLVTPKSFVVEVVDGYNVNNVAELSMLDNWSPLWAEYKAAHGLSMEEKPNRIILHNDIVITKNDVPAGFFYSENDVTEARMPGCDQYTGPDNAGKSSLIGSLKDYVGVYTHNTPEGETFIFDGNFFNIDASTFPVIRKFRDARANEWNEAEGGHAELFALPGDGLDAMANSGTFATSDPDDKEDDSPLPNLDATIPEQPKTAQGNVIMRNMSFVGNGGLVVDGNRSELNNGGLIFSKTGAETVTWENVNTIKTFISFFSRDTIGKVAETVSNINYCRAYDSYSTMVYYYASKNNYINNSVLKQSGGSLIICDEVWDKNTHTNRQSNLTTTNCELVSNVTGSEPWFTQHQATGAVGQLIALGELFDGYKVTPLNPNAKNIVTDNTINIIVLLMRASNVFDNIEYDLDSTVQINDSTKSMSPKTFATNNPYYGYAIANTESQMLAFESSAGGRALLFSETIDKVTTYDFASLESGSSLLRFSNIASAAEQENAMKFFSGNTMNLYLKAAAGVKPLGVVLGY
ncbi:MAG: hypothetical protein LBM03_01260 [Erysipelotrichaceae bacterium]|jgi:hypothetical protein|nr:hypothetical protein [Erysipelotrichaceae bacterium]